MPAVFLVSCSKDLRAWANYSNLTLCKICQNTSFLRHVFSCIRTKSTTLLLYGKISLSEKCRYSEFFWSVFSPNVGKYGPEKKTNTDTFHAVSGSEKNNILTYFTQCKLISYNAITKYCGATVKLSLQTI